MEALTVTFFVWGLGLMFVGILAAIAGVKFMFISRRLKDKAELVVKSVENRTKMQYNRIATMSPSELHSYLTVIYSRCLILAADVNVSERDPDGVPLLYTAAVSALLEYLGNDTVAAINYYYGDGYVIRWAKEAYRTVEYEGLVADIIARKNNMKGLATHISQWQ